MKVSKSLRIAHTSSVLVSVVINGLLLLVLLTFITMSETSERDASTVMVIDPVAQEEIDILEEEIVPEEVADPDELDDMMDFTMDNPMETEFTQETEVVDQVTETNVSSLSELMSDVSSPVTMTGLLVGRTPTARKAAAAKYGKGLEKYSEPAVYRALKWLKEHQHENGSWTHSGNTTGGGTNSGLTGVALLAFLAHGETPASAEFGPTVARGIRFLVENQDARGILQPAGAHTAYGHAMATYALAEAYTMTDNILLKEPLQRAVNVIIKGQMKLGGYDYGYVLENRNDVSLGAWNLQALKAAYLSKATGPETGKYLQSAMDGMLTGSKKYDGRGRGFSYTVAGTDPVVVLPPSHVISAAGTLCLHLAGRGRSTEAKDAVEFISAYTETEKLPNWPEWREGGYHGSNIGGEIYYWYYAVQAFFQEDPDGKNFNRFMPALVKALAQNQKEDGSWLCYTNYGIGRGPTYNTAFGALALMVYYRYLPTTQASNMQQAGAVEELAPVVDEGDVTFEL